MTASEKFFTDSLDLENWINSGEKPKIIIKTKSDSVFECFYQLRDDLNKFGFELGLALFVVENPILSIKV